MAKTAAARKAAEFRAEGTIPTKDGGKTAAEAAVAPERDLDDPATQDAILHPEPAPVTIGGIATVLHPLSARRARQFVAIVAEVMATALTKPNAIATGMRIATAIAENDALSTRFAEYVARAENAPDVIANEAAIGVRASAVNESANFQELAGAFARMCDLNNVQEVFGSPK